MTEHKAKIIIDSPSLYNIYDEIYNKGKADEREHIVGILFGIDRQVAELVKEILNDEKEQKNET